MHIVGSSEPRIIGLEVTDDSIVAQLADGRTVSVPLAWSWRLSEATPEQRHNFEIMGSGQGVHWPDVDEDISAIGMLSGTPARCPKISDDYELRDEYDLSKMTIVAKGRYAPDRRAGKNVVLLAPDVAQAFPTDEAVNEALRLVLRMAKIPSRYEAETAHT